MTKTPPKKTNTCGRPSQKRFLCFLPQPLMYPAPLRQGSYIVRRARRCGELMGKQRTDDEHQSD